MATSNGSRLGWPLLVVLAIVALGLASPIVIAAVNGNPGNVILGPVRPADVWQEDLVSDVPGLARYQFDPIVNPMGIEKGPLGYLVVANTGSGCLTVHQPSGLPVLSPYKPLVVVVPPAADNKGLGLPTSCVSNHFDGFYVTNGNKTDRSLMLIATMDGLIQGWNPYIEKRLAIVVADQSATGAAYFGLDVAMSAAGPVLAAADFFNGKVDLFDARFKLIDKLVDFDIPAGFAPSNVRTFQGNFYVTYAKRADMKTLEVEKGVGLGYIDVFSPEGQFLHRLVSGGHLNAPWSLVVAPEQMHDLAGKLLVGNLGDGRINAFDIETGAFYRTLNDQNGKPMWIDGLGGLTFHQDFVHGGDASLYFTKAIDGGLHGLFGRMEPIKH